MSEISGVGGDIWSIPASNLADDQKRYAADGITDIALLEEGNRVSENLQWLNGLSADQLNERTVGNFDEGDRVTTYGDLKIYRQTEADLGNQIAILSQSGTGVGFDALGAGQANSSDVAALFVTNLLGNLQDNKPGALKAAQAYLSAAQAGGAPLPSLSAREALDTYHAESAYRRSNPHGNWGANDTASVALAVLTQESKTGES